MKKIQTKKNYKNFSCDLDVKSSLSFDVISENEREVS